MSLASQYPCNLVCLLCRSIFGSKAGQAVKRLADSDSEDEGEGRSRPKAKKPALAAGQAPTDLLTVSWHNAEISVVSNPFFVLSNLERVPFPSPSSGAGTTEEEIWVISGKTG